MKEVMLYFPTQLNSIWSKASNTLNDDGFEHIILLTMGLKKGNDYILTLDESNITIDDIVSLEERPNVKIIDMYEVVGSGNVQETLDELADDGYLDYCTPYMLNLLRTIAQGLAMYVSAPDTDFAEIGRATAHSHLHALKAITAT